jgi:hypothetical protein
LYAQNAILRPAEVKGHFIGESVAEFLSRVPEAQQQVNVCEQSPKEARCDRLLAAVKRGQRAEVSTSRWMNFVLDGGKLVKLTTLVNEVPDSVKADLTKKFGPRSSETEFPMQNAMGASWKDHLFVWDTPVVYVGLHEDNNPASQNHHFVLVIESRAEHTREHADAVLQ